MGDTVFELSRREIKPRASRVMFLVASFVALNLSDTADEGFAEFAEQPPTSR